jgi:hypothetical protein
MRVVALAMFYGPTVAFVVAGVAAGRRHRPSPWRTAAILAATSTAAWLLYAGLYQHETPCDGFPDRCPTVYGTRAPLPDEHSAGLLLLLLAFLVPAAVVGWRRLAPALTAGAALTVGPVALAMWTAPRGDNDGLWALVFWMLPGLGGLATAVSGGARQVRATDEPAPVPAVAVPSSRPPSAAPHGMRARFTAFGIDLVIVGLVLLGPLIFLSDAGYEEVASVVGFVASTAYLAVFVARRGATPGQRRLRLQVLDATTWRRLPLGRAVLRSGLIVVEVVLTFALVGLPLVAEIISLTSSGRSIVDHLTRTIVVPLPTRPAVPVLPMPSPSVDLQSDGSRAGPI